MDRQIANRLAAHDVAVILQPVHCFPDTWEKARCSDDSVGILNAAGVRLAVSPVRHRHGFSCDTAATAR